MIHAVWGTKNRLPYLTLDVKNKLIEHIKENARLKQIFIDTIYGHTEHLHCLIGLNADMSIAKTMNLLKGESAYWMNRSSVSESVVAKVRRYILNQDEHHQRTTYAKEYNNFIVRYKFRSK
jgi:putative transposase